MAKRNKTVFGSYALPRKNIKEKLDKLIDLLKKDNESYDYIELFAECGITVRSFYNWKHVESFLEDEEMQEKISMLDTLSQGRLIRGALNNKINAWFAKWILAVRHGMIETQKIEQKSEITHSGSVTINVVVEGSNEPINI